MNTVNWSEIATQIIGILLPILVAWLVAAVALLVGKIAPIINEKIHASFTSDQIAQAKAIAGVAVTYAEQVWKRPDVQAAFGSKKAIAEEYVTNALYSHGIKMSASDIEAIIESAVYKELNQGKLLEVQTGEVKIAPATVETVQVVASSGEEGHSLTPPGAGPG